MKNSGLILWFMSKESLKQAVELAGGQAHLARGIRERIRGSKVGQVHVWGWLNSVKIEVPPADVVLAIADFLDYRMTPHMLRPDLYPNPGDAMPERVKLAQAPEPRRALVVAFGEFGEPRSGADRREDGDRRTADSAFGEFGEPRDGDRRVEDRRKDGNA